MKRLLIFSLLLMTLMLWSRPVTSQESQLVAQGKITLEGSNHQIETFSEILADDGSLTAIVYHLNPAGFIIVTSDTELIPVYGYSFRNEFSLLEDGNTGLDMLKADIDLRKSASDITDAAVINENLRQWDAYINNNLSVLLSRDRGTFPPPSYNTPTGGWIVTQWDQGYPFNQFCPMDPDTSGRSVVGCVATAFAQVVHYHREIGDLLFSDEDDYTSDSYTSPVVLDDDYDTYNFLSFPELNEKADELRDCYGNGSNFTNEMKGSLSFACGILTRMQYSVGGSGTQTLYAGYAFMQRLGYESATNIYNITNTSYTTFSDDMVNGRPVLISILGGAEGHCIIIDGWNSDTDYYHLNMGWSGYDDGWYSLPEGMPSGYNVIFDAVANIEGGTVPVDILGFVNASGADAGGTVIELDGTVDYIVETDDYGMFEIAFVHEGLYDVTATLALPDGGFYYKQLEVYIDNTNTFLQIDMDNYETLTGNITASVAPLGTQLAVYQGTDLISSGAVNADGSYAMPGLLPGHYVMVASLAPNYGRVLHFEVDLQHQNFDLELFDYDDSTAITYAGDPVEDWSLIATTMSIGIKLSADELSGMEDGLISRVNFKAPIAPADGQLWAQIWQNEILVSEKEITEFTYGEELEITLDNFAIINSANDYYVGYKIHSLNAVLAWHDAGPRIAGKGAWFRTNSWTEVNPASDYNFCIEAEILNPIVPINETDIPDVFTMLHQNYPNPFNPTTTISFNLPSQGNVELKIYNIKGELIKTLLNENRQKGEYNIIWDGLDNNSEKVASGLYFYQLKTETHNETRKMILMK